VVTCAFERLRARRVELVTDEENRASRRVAELCGFQLEGVHRNSLRGPDGQLRNTCIYSRLALDGT
jgi:RimJ/RimL family protein N-acetyltransferase